jgi:hypothetical protein
MRYKPSPLTPVDAVQWNGLNFAEVLVICPQAELVGTMIRIPTPKGITEAFVGVMVLRYLGSGENATMNYELFHVLYEVQSL